MAERDPGPGDVLADRYEIQQELGRGGMATVYRGKDLRLQRPVAIKVFRGGFAEAVDAQRTTQEMRLLAAVNHPSVVSVLDASNGDGVFGAFLVMELVVGDDLGALLHRARGALAADFARRIVADVASALAVLHEQGVVHRDVKPANILVPSAASSSSTVVAAKLTDFGIAQLVDGARLTAPDSILGTAAYLSPEQVRGAAPRPASDVYSLGLVLLEALTGRRAFPGPAAESAMARLQRPPALPTDASPALADLLSRMTALDPAHRPTAADVAATLRELLVGRVTAPDAVQTAPTPVAGFAAFASRQPDDATLPQGPLLTPGRGMPLGEAVPVLRASTSARRRFPTLLAVSAAVLAAAVTGVAISAAANLSTPAAGDEGRSAPPTSTAPQAADAPAQDDTNVGAAVGLDAPKPTRTRTAPSTPTPTPTASSPTPTPSATSTPPPVEPSSTPSETVPPVDETLPTEEPPTTDPAPAPAPSEDDTSSQPVEPVAPPSDTVPQVDVSAT